MKRDLNIDRWIKRNTNKHLCQCGCGGYIKPNRDRYFSKRPMRFINLHQNRGMNHPHYGDGEIIAKGYYWILLHGHPRTTPRGYVKRCWLSIEKKIGRYLCEGEIVHHINGNKLDDRPENLEITDRVQHGKIHNTGENNKAWRGDVTTDVIFELRKSGMTNKQIASKFSCSSGLIDRRIRMSRDRPSSL